MFKLKYIILNILVLKILTGRLKEDTTVEVDRGMKEAYRTNLAKYRLTKRGWERNVAAFTQQ